LIRVPSATANSTSGAFPLSAITCPPSVAAIIPSEVLTSRLIVQLPVIDVGVPVVLPLASSVQIAMCASPPSQRRL
jgi:hypothetical protein